MEDSKTPAMISPRKNKDHFIPVEMKNKDKK